MANLKLMTAQEALNADVGGVWDVQAIGSVSSITLTDSVAIDVSGYSSIGVIADEDIKFHFDTVGVPDGDCTANDLVLAKEALTFITIPRGLGGTIYFVYVNESSTNNSGVRTVLV